MGEAVHSNLDKWVVWICAGGWVCVGDLWANFQANNGFSDGKIRLSVVEEMQGGVGCR